MKAVIHARLTEEDRVLLARLKRATGSSDSELIRRGLRLVQRDVQQAGSALAVAAKSAGKFRGGSRDLSTNRAHLDGLGE